MNILGDIGNTETKIWLVSKKNHIIKKINFSSKEVTNYKLSKIFKKHNFKFKDIEKILFCSVVPPTFNLIKKFLSKKTNCKYGMVISEIQTNGKGQYGRKWISYKGNLFVTFFHELNKIKLSITKITKLNCLLVKKLISKYTNKKIFYKKPNDLLIEKKKICGILQEIIFIQNKKYLITGIGININKSPLIKNCPTTYLNEITNKYIKINQIEKSLKQIFENNLLKMYNLKTNN